MRLLLVLVVIATIVAAIIFNESVLLNRVLIFAVVALGAIFTATYFLNKAADSAGNNSSGDQ